MPARAREALDRGHAVTLACAPPALGVRGIVDSWAARHDGTIEVDHRNDTLPDADEVAALAAGGRRIVIAVEGADRYPRATSGITVVPPHLLTMTEAEVADAVGSAIGSSAWSAEDIAETARRIHRLTAGWPGLVAAATAVGTIAAPADDAPLPWSLVVDGVMRRVRRDLLPWLPDDWREALEYVAVAGETSLDELRHPDLPPAPLVDLVGMGLLTRIVVFGEERLRLHPAVGEVLRSAVRRSGDQTLHDRLRAVVRIRGGRGLVDGGLAAAYELGDLPLCARLMERWWVRQTFFGHRKLSHRVLRSLPQELVRAHPTIACRAEILGILPVGTTPVTIPRTTEEIEACHQSRSDVDVLHNTLLAMVARRQHGLVEEARDIAIRSAPLSTYPYSPDAPAAGFLSLWCLHAGLSCHLADDPHRAHGFYRRGWQVLSWDTLGVVAKELASKLAVLAAVCGDNRDAARWLHEAGNQPPPHAWFDEPTRTGERIATLLLAIDSLDPAAIASAQEQLGDPCQLDEQWPFLELAQARMLMLRGEPHRVLDQVADARQLRPHATAGMPATQLSLLATDAHLALGHGTRATSILRTVPRTARTAPARARLLLLTGHPDSARTVAVHHLNQQDATAREQADLLLIQAAAELAVSDMSVVAATATAAAELIRSRGLHSHLTAIPRASLAALADTAPALAELLPPLAGTASVFPPSVTVIELSEREQVVLAALGTGASLNEITESLHVSRNTIKSQLRSLYGKLGVHSRDAAVVRAAELGLLIE